MWRHPTTTERIDQLEDKLNRLLDQRHEPTQIEHLFKHLEKVIMSAKDDLNAAIADLSIQIDTNNAEIETLLTKILNAPAGGTSDADIADAVAQIRTLIQKNKDEVTKAQTTAP